MSNEGWPCEASTDEVLAEFDKDLVELCRKHKLRAGAAVLFNVFPESQKIELKFCGEVSVVAVLCHKFGLPLPENPYE